MIRLLYEKDGIGYNFPWYVETFYYDPSRRWMIYVSHEGTITFTGNEITQAANNFISIYDKMIFTAENFFILKQNPL